MSVFLAQSTKQKDGVFWLFARLSKLDACSNLAAAKIMSVFSAHKSEIKDMIFSASSIGCQSGCCSKVLKSLLMSVCLHKTKIVEVHVFLSLLGFSDLGFVQTPSQMGSCLFSLLKRGH